MDLTVLNDAEITRLESALDEEKQRRLHLAYDKVRVEVRVMVGRHELMVLFMNAFDRIYPGVVAHVERLKQHMAHIEEDPFTYRAEVQLTQDTWQDPIPKGARPIDLGWHLMPDETYVVKAAISYDVKD